MGSTKIDSVQLRHELAQFTGTEKWYRHGINRHMLYTEGVQYFCERAGCYWFLDIVATEHFRLQRLHPFLAIALEAGDSKANIFVDDGDGKPIYRRHIEYTDCPDGTWRFYLTDNVMLLPSEY